MINVCLARIDDRLIHGQVMAAWAKYVQADRIIIIDDETFSDAFICNFITGLYSGREKIEIYDTETAIQVLKNGSDNDRVILLVKSPQIFYLLVKNGVEIHEIILGGMAARENRKKLFKNIAVSDDEIRVLKLLLSLGVNIKVQIVPDEKAINIEILMER